MAASSSLTTVASKQLALKERAYTQKKFDADVDQLVKLHVDGGDVDNAAISGCFSKLVSCSGLANLHRFRRTAVSTVEHEAKNNSASSAKTSSKNQLMTRLVGQSKTPRHSDTDTVRIETAMKSVQGRVDALRERVRLGRQRALAAKKASRREEALRELKKSKAVEKQLATASAALEALERQEDMLAQSTLQRELAAALSTTNSEVKKKHKGLLSFAEKAVDESVELNDDAEDIGAVFDGLVGPTDSGVDEDELLEELNAMADETTGDVPGAANADDAVVAGAHAAFPTAPKSCILPSAMPSSLEKRRLLPQQSST